MSQSTHMPVPVGQEEGLKASLVERHHPARHCSGERRCVPSLQGASTPVKDLAPALSLIRPLSEPPTLTGGRVSLLGQFAPTHHPMETNKTQGNEHGDRPLWWEGLDKDPAHPTYLSQRTLGELLGRACGQGMPGPGETPS